MNNRNSVSLQMCWCIIILGQLLIPTIVSAEVFRDDNSTFTITLPNEFKKLDASTSSDGIGNTATAITEITYGSDILPISVITLSETYVNLTNPNNVFDIQEECTKFVKMIKDDGFDIEKYEMRNGSCYIQSTYGNRFVYMRTTVSENKRECYMVGVQFLTSIETLNQYQKIAKEIVESLTLLSKEKVTQDSFFKKARDISPPPILYKSPIAQKSATHKALINIAYLCGAILGIIIIRVIGGLLTEVSCKNF